MKKKKKTRREGKMSTRIQTIQEASSEDPQTELKADVGKLPREPNPPACFYK